MYRYVPVSVLTLFIILLGSVFMLPAISAADEGNGFTIEDFLKDEAENFAKDLIIGDIPSDEFNLITNQVYDQFLAGGYATNKKYSVCQRAANAQAEVALSDLNHKWWQGGWFNLAYKAIKYSTVIGASVGVADVVTEELRGQISNTVKDLLAEEPSEVVELSNGGKCGLTTVALWNKQEQRVEIKITGDCGCRVVKPRRFDLSKTKLKDFEVNITADVEIGNVEVEEKNPYIFWRDRQVRVFFKVKSMVVDTIANCNCGIVDPPPEEKEDGSEPEAEEKDPITTEPEDGTEPPEDEEDTEGSETQEDEEQEETRGFIGAFVDWLLGRDGTGGPEDDTTDPAGEKEDEEEGERDNTKPLMCGDSVSVEGRTGVATFVYRETATSNVNFSCNNSCAPHQRCSVLPESVGAYSDSCVYCANVCNTGEFSNESSCSSAKGSGQECVATGTNGCFALKEKKKDPLPAAQNCEAAVRLLLDEYMGWFDPPVTFTSGKAVLSHEHRCFPEEDYDKFTRQPAIQGTKDASIRAMCPTLIHSSSVMTRLTAGSKGLCRSDTTFSF